MLFLHTSTPPIIHRDLKSLKYLTKSIVVCLFLTLTDR
jgi:hypothetical protein